MSMQDVAEEEEKSMTMKVEGERLRMERLVPTSGWEWNRAG